MQATLFFDESEANAVFNVRQQPPHRQQLQHELYKRSSQAIEGPTSRTGTATTTTMDDEATPEARYAYQSFSCSGSLPVPELDATLTWWLDDGLNASVHTAPGTAEGRFPSPGPVRVHLLVVNSKQSATRTRSAQTRKLSVELPVCGAGELLTCGVTKLVRGGHCLSVAWLTTSMEAGYVRVVLQRDADACGTLLMTPEGEMVRSQPIRTISHAAAGSSSASALLSLMHQGKSRTSQDNSNNGSGTALLPFLRNGNQDISGGSRVNDGGGEGGAAWSQDEDEGERAAQQRQLPRCGPHTSACVLAEIPTIDAGDLWEQHEYLSEGFYQRSNPATQPAAQRQQQSMGRGGSNTAAVAAMFAVTDGRRVWRVKLMENGLTSHVKLADNKKKEQVGLLCAQLNKAAMSHGYGAATSFRHPLFSELSNLQRVTRSRSIEKRGGSQGNGTRAAEEEEEDELSFASVNGEAPPDAASSVSHPSASSSSSPQEKPKGWLTRFLGGVGREAAFRLPGTGGGDPTGLACTPQRRFLCVSAVQNSPYIALLRWNGLVEFYDSDLAMVEHFPTCYIPPQELAPSAGLFHLPLSEDDANHGGCDGDGEGAAADPLVQQWCTLNIGTNAIHYFASMGTLEGRRCVWARVPAVERTSDEKVVLRCAYGVVPPASGSSPMACGVNAREELAVLWDVGVEEDAHLSTARSISSLFNPTSVPVSAALQIVRGERGAEEAWVWRETETFLCHTSGRLRAVLSEGAEFVLVEKASDFHRAYVLHSTMPTPPHHHSRLSGRQQDNVSDELVATLVETIRVDMSDEPDNEDGTMPFSSYQAGYDDTFSETSVLQCVGSEDSLGGSGGVAGYALRAVRLVPTTTPQAVTAVMAGEQQSAADGALRLFSEGCDTLQSCVHGAALLSELLRDAQTCSFSSQQLIPALSRIMHEAHLAGHAPCDAAASDCPPDGHEGREESGMHGALLAAIAAATRVSRAAHPERNADGEAAASSSPFCSFSRHYILSAVLRSLLHRIAFLVVTLIGAYSCRDSSLPPTNDGSIGDSGGAEHWERAIATHAMPVNKGNGVMALVQTIQLLVAAYHAAQMAGPDLAHFALPPPTAPQGYASGDDIVRAVLQRFLYQASASSPGQERQNAPHTASLPFFVLHVANGLYRCCTPRTVRASATWAAQLQHHFPILTHFRLLVSIDAGRTTHSTQQQDMCMKVVRSLAALGESAAVPLSPSPDSRAKADFLRSLPAQCLLEEGLLVADVACCSGLARLLCPGSAGFHEVRAWAVERASLAPKLYAVGILRRLMPNLNSSNASSWPTASPATGGGSSPATTAAMQQQQQRHTAAVSSATVRHYYLTQLMQVRGSVVAMHTKDHQIPPASSSFQLGAFPAISSAPSPHAWSALKAALDELLLDTLLYLAQCAVAEFDFGACWHDLEAALELAEELDVLYLYVNPFHSVLGKVVECACAGQAHMDSFISASSTTYAAVALEELLVVKWYNYIARMPTKSASDATEALRYRSIMGLHRYLMSRHAFALCGRVMSDLASLLRCSPLRRAGGGSAISVGELAALALAAVELIAPIAPVEEEGHSGDQERPRGEGGSGGGGGRDTGNALAGSPISTGFAWRSAQQQQHQHQHQQPYDNSRSGSEATTTTTTSGVGRALHRRLGLALATSPLSGGMTYSAAGGGDGSSGAGHATTPTRLLSRDDLPWLRRRVYQAHCERQLWRCGSTLDCTDIWIDGAPVEDFRAGVRKLTEALESAELWPEAYRFATLAEVDAVPVLQHWAIHLTRRNRDLNSHAALANLARNTNHLPALDNESDEIFDQWLAIVGYCTEQSALSNQFAGFSRVLLEVLTVDYENTAPELRDAHKAADPYTAAATLLQVYSVLRRKLSASRLAASRNENRSGSDEEEARSGSDGEGPEDGISRAELADRCEALCWLPWAHAAQICTEVLTTAAAAVRGNTNANSTIHGDDGRGQRHSQDLEVFTAGVIDPLARYAKQLHGVSSQVKAIVAERHGLQLDRIAAEFMQSVNAI